MQFSKAAKVHHISPTFFLALGLKIFIPMELCDFYFPGRLIQIFVYLFWALMTDTPNSVNQQISWFTYNGVGSLKESYISRYILHYR